MQEVYSVLMRHDPEWDGQNVIYIKSKALFDLLQSNEFSGDNVYFDDFSEELKRELTVAYEALNQEIDYPLDPIGDMDIGAAIELLEYTALNQFPMVLLGHTECTMSWNW